MVALRIGIPKAITACALAAILALAATAHAEPTAYPWLDRHLSPDARTALVLQQLTLDEKIQLVHSQFTKRDPRHPPPAGPEDEQGYVAGIPRLRIPPLHMVDGNLGVANPWNARDNDEATALPSGLALAATWNPALAFASGATEGAEAHSRGFNVLLAGSVNLVRDPHGGRTFEYAGEDPLLAGVMVGAAIRGIQSQHVISTIKHFAVNDRESGRFTISADIDEKALRESDLLAFQIAIERGDPGAVMCAYNKVNGVYACENSFLLQTMLRSSWNYRGWVMSDWGAVHSTVASATAGLDQESGDKFDQEIYFGEELKEAITSGQVPMARLDAMASHILRTMFAKGVVDDPPAKHAVDESAHAAVAERIAEEGMVLLRNEGKLLPLSVGTGVIAIIGSHADRAVLSGGGSSQVRPMGGPALTLPPPEGAPRGTPNTVWDPSSPLDAIKAQAPSARIRYADGTDIAAAAALAKAAQIAIVFVHQWMSEGWDRHDLSLPDDQDRLIEAVAAANPRTIVVLETGGPVLMPWIARVGAVLEAWYPGQSGGKAIARILFGKADPSGRLPVTFPASEAQLPAEDRVQSAAQGSAKNVRYREGAAVGYRWFETAREKPLFAFGDGLTYTDFSYADLQIAPPDSGNHAIHASVTIRNTGRRSGAEIAQLYVSRATSEGPSPRRLAAWKRVELRPGETRRVTLDLDQHALQVWSRTRQQWETPAGDYRILVSASAVDDRLSANLPIP
jgi:beta-glucosidase